MADTIEIKVKQGEVTDAIKNLKDIQDLITTISKTPVTLNVQTFVNAINNLGQAANNAGQAAGTLGNNVIKTVEVFKGADGTAGAVVKKIETLQNAIGVTEERVSVLNKDTQELDLTTTRLTTDVEKQAKALEKAAAAAEKQGREAVNADKKAASLSSSFDSLITTIQKLEKSYPEQTFTALSGRIKDASDKLGELVVAYASGEISQKEFTSELQRTDLALAEYNAELSAIKRAAGDAPEQMKAATKSVEEQAKAFDTAQAAVTNLETSYSKLISAINVKEGKYAEGTFTALKAEIQATREELSNYDRQLQNGTMSQELYTAKVDEAKQKLQEYESQLAAILADDYKLAIAEAELAERAEKQAKAFDTAQAAVTNLETSYSKLISAINVKEGKYAEGTFTALKAEVQATREELSNYDRQLQNGTMSQELYTAKVDEAKQKLQEYESQLAAILADDYKLAIAEAGLAASAEKQAKALQAAQDVAVKLSGSFAELDGKIGNLQSKYPEGTFDGISAAIAAARSDLERLNAEFASGQITDVQYTDGIASLSRTYDALSASIKVTKNDVEQLQPPLEETASLVDKLGTAFSNLITRLGRRYLISSFREAIDTMQAVDDELVNISKITGDTVEELGNLEDAAYRVAAALGVSADEHLNNTAAFYRAGYREQADELALLADKIEIISGMTAEQAQQFIISSDAAYQYGGNVEALTRIMDGAISIDNNYATTVQKIAEGIGIVAPVASQVHVSIEELTAALGTITAVTQRTGSESARALRALFLNIVGDTKTEIDEGVTWTTGEIAGLQDVIHKYAADVVEAAEATGSVINPMEAIRALNQAMKDGLLSEAELMETVSDIGGKLRSSQLLAIVQNWDMYESMLSEFETSAGNTEAKVEAAMDSWSVKSQQLQNAWTEFVSNLVDTGAIKDALDGVIKLVELLNTDFGRTVVVFATVASAGVGLVGVIGNIVGAIRNAITILGASNPVVLGVTAAVAALAAGWYAVKQAQDDYAQKVNEFVPELSGLQRVYQSTAEAIDGINDSYSESIEETVEAANKARYLVSELEKLESQTDDTTSGNQRYKEIIGELNELIPGLNLAIDSTTGQLNIETTAIYNQIAGWERLAQVQAATEQYKELYKQKLTLEQKTEESKQAADDAANTYNELYNERYGDLPENSKKLWWWILHPGKVYGKENREKTEAVGVARVAAEAAIKLHESYKAELAEVENRLELLAKSGVIDYSVFDFDFNSDTTLGDYKGGNTYSSGETGKIKTADEVALEWIQGVKSTEKARLQYLEASGASAEELVEQYKLLQAITHDEAEKLRDIEESQNGVRGETADTLKLSTEWWKYQDEINELLEKAEETVEEIAEEEYDLKSALEETVALLKEVNGAALDEATDLIDKQIDAIDEQIDALKAKNKAEEESNALEEKRLDLLEAEEKLQNAKDERLIRTFNADSGQWERIAKHDDVESAQKAVSEAAKALSDAQQEAETNEKLTELEAQKDALEAEKASLKAQYEEQESAWDALIKSLEEPTQDLITAFQELVTHGTDPLVKSMLNTAMSFGFTEEDISQTLEKFGLEEIDGNLGDALEKAGKNLKEFSQELVKTSILNRMMRRSDAWFDASDEERAQLKALNEADAKSIGLVRGETEGAWYWADTGEMAYLTNTQKSHAGSGTGSSSGSSSSSSSDSSDSGSGGSSGSGSNSGSGNANSGLSGITVNGNGAAAGSIVRNSAGDVLVTSGGGAPAGLTVGTNVVTNGGVYKITGVKSDGTYNTEKVRDLATGNAQGNNLAGIFFSGTYDSGGVLHGMGGIKATNEDEVVLPPNVAKAMLAPQNSTAFSQRLSELSYLYGANGSSTLPMTGNTLKSSNDHYGDSYNYGNITLTENQARGMTVYDLARLAKGLAIYS